LSRTAIGKNEGGKARAAWETDEALRTTLFARRKEGAPDDSGVSPGLSASHSVDADPTSFRKRCARQAPRRSSLRAIGFASRCALVL
jgi:hypothetical protein